MQTAAQTPVVCPAAEGLAVVELRQYTTRPRQREALIKLFERHFLTAQAKAGAPVIGHFRDLDDPDRFVWLRGFADMPTRKAALEAFYDSTVWHAHRDGVNAMIVDYENVLLLRPLVVPPRPEQETQMTIVGATIFPFKEPVGAEDARTLAEETARLLAEVDALPLGVFVTEPSANNFPRLPIRECDNVCALLARFDSPAAYDVYRTVLVRLRQAQKLAGKAGACLAGPPELLRLRPCAHSSLR